MLNSCGILQKLDERSRTGPCWPPLSFWFSMGDGGAHLGSWTLEPVQEGYRLEVRLSYILKTLSQHLPLSASIRPLCGCSVFQKVYETALSFVGRWLADSSAWALLCLPCMGRICFPDFFFFKKSFETELILPSLA